MAAIHPDFRKIQERLRRINSDWYPERLALDNEYGPGMARGLDAALDLIEEAKGITPIAPPAPPPIVAAKPVAPVSSAIPARFRFLLQNPIAPLMVRIGLEMLGLKETPGAGNNPEIVGWADEVARSVPTAYARWAADWYNADSIPWCGLWMAVVTVRASQGRSERLPPEKYLAALEWAKWGEQVPINAARVGDVMVLGRSGGGHVTLNVGMETGLKRFFGLGANQSDAITIAPFGMDRVVAVRRPPYNQTPPGARRVIVSASGEASSVNEA